MKNAKSANETTKSATCEAVSQGGRKPQSNPKADALEAVSRRLSGYADELGKAAESLRSGSDEREALFCVSDIHSYIGFDLDELDEIAGLGYSGEKSCAIIAVAGVAATLSHLAENLEHVSVGRGQLRKLSDALTAAARTLDNHANRCDLYGGMR